MNRSLMLSVIVSTVLLSVASARGQAQFWQSRGELGQGSITGITSISGMYVVTVGTKQAWGSGVYRSTDVGLSWTLVSDTIPKPSTSNHSMVVVDDSILILGGYSASASMGALFRSTDRGESWVRIINYGTVSWGVVSLASDSAGYVYGGTMAGQFIRSSDKGATWSEVYIPGWPGPNVGVDSRGNVYTKRSDATMIVSPNHGQSWDTRPAPGMSAFTPLPNGDILVGTSDGVYHSTNTGLNWDKLVSCSANAIAYSPSAGILVGTTQGVLRSLDSGKTWGSLSSGLLDSNVVSLYIDGSGRLFAGTDKGNLYICAAPGNRWELTAKLRKINAKLPSLLISPGGYTYAARPADYLIASPDNGDTWYTNSRVYGNTTGMVCTPGDTVYASCPILVQSIDHGHTWLEVASSEPSITAHTLAMSPNGNLYGFMETGFRRSTDGGKTWKKIPEDLYWGSVECLSINSSGDLFAGTKSYIYRSTDDGQNWNRLANGLSYADVTTIVFDSAGYAFAGTPGGGIFRSSDNGDTWSHVSYGMLDTMIVTSMVVASNDEIYVGTDDASGNRFNGIYRSSDHGTTWSEKNEGLLTRRILSLAADKRGVLMAGTEGGGLYVASLSTVPQYVSPHPGAQGMPLSCLLKWTRPIGTASFEVQVSSDSLFSAGMVIDRHSVMSDTLTVTGLAYETSYYWRVRDDNGGAFSKAFSFRTLIKVPDPPVIVSPSHMATAVSLNPIIRWQRPATSISFHLQLSQDSTFASAFVVNDSSLVDTLAAVPPLDYSTSYHIRIRARNNGGYGTWLTNWEFRTLDPDPSTPRLLAPAHLATALDTPVTVSWTRPTGVTMFHLQVCPDSTFPAGPLLREFEAVDSFWVVRDLEFLTSYWWRVDAYQAGTGWALYSTARKFTTGLPIPGKVLLGGPPNTTVISSDTLRIWWRKAEPSVDKYWMQYSTDSVFSTSIVHSAVTDTTDVLRALANNTHYYWKVRAHNATGWGPISAVGHFQRILTGIDATTSGVPGDWTLLQNYPNPFNPTTDISFGVPQKGKVVVVVYNILGESVAELANSVFEPGYHVVRFDGSVLPSGVYFYRMQAEGFVQTRKLIMVR
jgi:photosystem II stability/assembly factor-like uncharacterized protein